VNIEIANEHPSINEIFERTIKDINIPPRPIILERVKVEMRKEDPIQTSGPNHCCRCRSFRWSYED